MKKIVVTGFNPYVWIEDPQFEQKVSSKCMDEPHLGQELLAGPSVL